MLNRLTPYLLSLLMVSTSVSADTIGFTIGAAIWNHAPSGNLAYSESGTATEIDLDETLDLSTEAEGFFWLAIEHPVPLLPNIKLQHSSINSEGSNTISQNVRFGDTTYTLGDDLDSEISLSQSDFTLYYEVLDNIFSLDLGMNVKVIDADLSISSTTSQESTSLELYVPMLYAAVKFDLPLSGVYLGGSGSVIGYSGNSYSDYLLNIGYESDIGLGVEGGYRSQKIELDEIEDISADFQFSGAYLGMFYHF